jgi:hypothetical protein
MLGQALTFALQRTIKPRCGLSAEPKLRAFYFFVAAAKDTLVIWFPLLSGS